ncbi:MAG: DUF2202 domain-containing protein [Thermodesulfobacteriota bacterium]
MRKTIMVLIFGGVVSALAFSLGADAAGPSSGGKKTLTDGDEVYLIFMRSEEKLARDVYLTLGELFPGSPVFNNIACLSEQTHTEKVRVLLEKFKIADPEDGTSADYPAPDADEVGYFQSKYFTSYFTEKFNGLTAVNPQDPGALLAALKNGAKIEELDMKDINYCNDVIYKAFEFPPPPPDYCGLAVTDVWAIENTMGNLLAGSVNHLCAFVGQIMPLLNGACYENQVLSATEVGDIITANCPELFAAYGCEATICDYEYKP